MPLSYEQIASLQKAKWFIDQYVLLLTDISMSIIDDAMDDEDRDQCDSLSSNGVALWAEHGRVLGTQMKKTGTTWLPF